MAYTNSWDEAQPAGSAAANTLDTIIQNVKKDVRERIEDAFPDWANDAVDPKRVVIHYDTAANIPASPNTGEFFYETDTSLLKLYNGSSWTTIQAAGGAGAYVETGALGARPAAGNAGRLYYATDVETLYVDDGTSWDAIGGTGSLPVDGDIFYDDSQPAGSKGTGTANENWRIVSVFLQAQTDASGFVYINRSEFPSPMDTWQFQSAVASPTWPGGAKTAILVRYINITAAQISIELVNSTSGSIFPAGTLMYLFVHARMLAP